MATAKQQLGEYGERMVMKHANCPRCKKSRTLKQLKQNFACADIICEFCNFIMQVKASTQPNIEKLPSTLPSAAWSKQKERMDASIYTPLFVVLVIKGSKKFSIYYLTADYQVPEMFIKRKKLSEKAKRAGWQGTKIDLRKVSEGAIVRVC